MSIATVSQNIGMAQGWSSISEEKRWRRLDADSTHDECENEPEGDGPQQPNAEMISNADLMVFLQKIAKRHKFLRLAKSWKQATRFFGSVDDKVMHPLYQQIIGMGEAAVPLIIEDLKTNGPKDWFWALTAITGENPISEKIAGDMQSMTEAWLRWAADNMHA